MHVFVFKLHLFYQFQTTSSLNIICKMICFVQKLSFHRSDRLGWLDLARQAAIFEGQETLIYALLHFYAASTAFYADLRSSTLLCCLYCAMLFYAVLLHLPPVEVCCHCVVRDRIKVIEVFCQVICRTVNWVGLGGIQHE